MGFLEINGSSVVHEEIDGEVVIVDLDKGLYFSTDGVGASVWTRIVGGQSVDAVLDWAAETYPVESIRTDVSRFLDDLQENGLVIEAESVAAAHGVPAAAPAQYAEPKLNVYEDMEDLLLLDPIHDVSEDDGWPNKPSG